MHNFVLQTCMLTCLLCSFLGNSQAGNGTSQGICGSSLAKIENSETLTLVIGLAIMFVLVIYSRLVTGVLYFLFAQECIKYSELLLLLTSLRAWFSVDKKFFNKKNNIHLYKNVYCILSEEPIICSACFAYAVLLVTQVRDRDQGP